MRRRLIGRGVRKSEQDMETLLGWVKELGGNYVRLAHYPHDQRMTRLADRMGMLVWSEVPVYWAVQFEKPEVLAKAQAAAAGDDSAGQEQGFGDLVVDGE